jgi:hypothetical protein
VFFRQKQAAFEPPRWIGVNAKRQFCAMVQLLPIWVPPHALRGPAVPGQLSCWPILSIRQVQLWASAVQEEFRGSCRRWRSGLDLHSIAAPREIVSPPRQPVISVEFLHARRTSSSSSSLLCSSSSLMRSSIAPAKSLILASVGGLSKSSSGGSERSGIDKIGRKRCRYSRS